ncbi:hypothetical protein [Acinetobacter venetianus]|uniref:hypothetical protein n=1 Tax=Acinetobacter venetianus TaxID=52133 RepID=UPI001022B845|nr:hypothetical protein [Acinetobacter venetianus]RZG79657.1 hypothetical protein EXE23_13430 [Acinetobacter venetianus]
MKERPILFNTAMVQAILSGNKTQTRRIVKPQPEVCDDARGGHWWPSSDVQSMVHVEKELQDYEGFWRGLIDDCNPFGAKGDRLWVRESWYQKGTVGRTYPDDDEYQFFGHRQAAYVADGDAPKDWTFKKRPSIHMPRWACRLILEITNIRIERLQNITTEDAKAEGFDYSTHPSAIEMGYAIGAKTNFRFTWEQIYGQNEWNKNPWVWVVEFKVIQGGAA